MRTGFTGAELRARLRQYDRTPFIELLAGWLECLPTEDAVKAFAEKSPDKYISALVQIARVGGYVDKMETNVNINVAIGNMSDSQIQDRINELHQELGLPLIEGKVVDAKFDEVK